MLQPADADALADRFGLRGPAELAGPVDRGELGQVWRLTTRSGAYAVKETFGTLDDAQIARAADLQQRAAGTGVRSPRQLVTPRGDLAIRDFGSPVRVFEWCELGPSDRGIDPGALGRMLAALHTAAPAAQDAVDPFFCSPVGESRWRGLAADWNAAHAPFAEDLNALVDELILSESVMVEPTTSLIISHRDLWADNVRTDPRGGLVVFDWDNCGPAAAPQELAMIMVEFATTPARARALYEAYRAGGGPAALTGLSDFTMALATPAHLVEMDVRRWLDADPAQPAGTVARSRAERRLAEFTSDPVTIATARWLLGALSPAAG